MSLCSVIIPAYNAERYVARAIASALVQTHRDLEIIVVNDGSTDGTAREVDRFRDRIIYVEQDNMGLAGARNRGLDVASGEFIALLDADDTWTPHHLEVMLEALRSEADATLATCDAYLRSENNPIMGTFYSTRPRHERFRPDNQPYWIVQYNFVFIMAVVRKTVFERHGKFDETLRAAEDWDLWLRFITAGEHARLVNQPLGHYLVRPGSLSHDARRVWPYEVRILEKAASAEASKSIPGVKGRLALARGKVALSNEDFQEAAEHFRESFKDSDLPNRRRLQALALSASPALAWKAYGRKFQ